MMLLTYIVIGVAWTVARYALALLVRKFVPLRDPAEHSLFWTWLFNIALWPLDVLFAVPLLVWTVIKVLAEYRSARALQKLLESVEGEP